MTVNQSQKEKKKRNGSSLVSSGTRLIGVCSSKFKRSFVGRTILNSGDTFNNSFIRKKIAQKKQGIRHKNTVLSKLAVVCENGFVAKAAHAISDVASTMSVAVYGLFFLMFGIVTILSHFASIYVIPNPSYDGSLCFFVGFTTAICSIPFLSSSKSVIQLFAGGKLARRITNGFFLIPEEKFWNQTKRGGVYYMVISGFLGIGCGVLSYFTNPIYIIATFFTIVGVMLVLSFPEIGIILSCAVMPFLQYIKYTDSVIFFIVAVTAISYIIKLIRGRRTFHMSGIGVMVFVFGITMLIAGIFSSGGEGALKYSLFNVLIIFGAFFIGGNLTKNDDVRRVCTKILTVSLVAIAFLQFWNLYYMEISDGVKHSLMSDYRSIIGSTALGGSSNLKVPGLWAALVSPLIISACFNRKRIFGVVALLLCYVPVALSIVYFGTVEIMIALIIGVIIYLLFHSSRSAINTVVIAVCVGVVLCLVPVILGYAGVENAPTYKEILEPIINRSQAESAYRSQIVSDTYKMIFDGNIWGIGSGEGIFKSAMAGYYSTATENASMPGTSFMQIFCEAGIFGISVFAAFVVFLLKNGIKYIIVPTSRQSKILTLGLLSGFISALILGFFSCIFENAQMRYLFWLFAGLISSQSYSENSIELAQKASMKNNPSEIDVIERI